MSTSRRRFLKSGILAGLAAGFCLKEGALALAQNSGKKPDKKPDRAGKKRDRSIIPEGAKMNEVFFYTKKTFDPYLGTEFAIRTGIVTTTLTLIEVIDCSPNRKDDCFVLIFKADRELPKGVTILKLQHDALGKFELSLEGWKNFKDPEGIYYQAVINHALE
ncbi:MAG: hypothetical protein ICV60_01240 [Pyrinomonadaceae bacterium]|nr:hypothetical protein [Pyrinomonadaceae bacterium]